MSAFNNVQLLNAKGPQIVFLSSFEQEVKSRSMEMWTGCLITSTLLRGLQSLGVKEDKGSLDLRSSSHLIENEGNTQSLQGHDGGALELFAALQKWQGRGALSFGAKGIKGRAPLPSGGTSNPKALPGLCVFPFYRTERGQSTQGGLRPVNPACR